VTLLDGSIEEPFLSSWEQEIFDDLAKRLSMSLRQALQDLSSENSNSEVKPIHPRKKSDYVSSHYQEQKSLAVA